jgi:hypothetical protein
VEAPGPLLAPPAPVGVPVPEEAPPWASPLDAVPPAPRSEPPLPQATTKEATVNAARVFIVASSHVVDFMVVDSS